jgi:hypothetical protein
MQRVGILSSDPTWPAGETVPVSQSPCRLPKSTDHSFFIDNIAPYALGFAFNFA